MSTLHPNYYDPADEEMPDCDSDELSTPAPAQPIIDDDQDDEPISVAPISSFKPLPDHARIDAELGRNACPWLDEYIAFSRKWSPRSFDDFHETIGLWLLSTVAARRVQVIGLGRPRYTNLNLLLVARSTLYAKSEAAHIGSELLAQAGLTYLLAPDEMTPEALLQRMAGTLPANYGVLSSEQQGFVQQQIGFAAQRGWFYDEFGQKISAMMRSSGPMSGFHSLLRRMDDSKPTYENATKTSGTDFIKRPYLALLGAMTPADLQPFARKGAPLWNDGFLARFAFVTPPSGHEPGDQRWPQGETLCYPHTLVQPLREWHERLGLPLVTINEGRDKRGQPNGEYTPAVVPPEPVSIGLDPDVYEAFYRYLDALISLCRANENTDQDASYGRFSEKTIRVAALLACKSGSQTITMAHWARAQEIAERWRASLHNLADQLDSTVTQTKEAELEDKVYQMLARMNKPSSAPDLHRAGLRNRYSTDQIDQALEWLEKYGRIGFVETSRKGARRYTIRGITQSSQAANGDIPANSVNSAMVNSVNDDQSFTIRASFEQQQTDPRIVQETAPQNTVSTIHYSTIQPAQMT